MLIRFNERRSGALRRNHVRQRKYIHLNHGYVRHVIRSVRNKPINQQLRRIIMKLYLIQATALTVYAHEVMADSPEQAREKFYKALDNDCADIIDNEFQINNILEVAHEKV